MVAYPPSTGQPHQMSSHTGSVKLGSSMRAPLLPSQGPLEKGSNLGS
jgi:hypothetical protein